MPYTEVAQNVSVPVALLIFAGSLALFSLKVPLVSLQLQTKEPLDID